MVLSVDMIQLKTSIFIFYSFHDLSSTISYWFEKYVSLLAYNYKDRLSLRNWANGRAYEPDELY